MDQWIDSWTVVLCKPDNTMHQHNFLLSKRAGRLLGEDRAEHDAKAFATAFQDSVRILYCGPTHEMSAHLRQEIAENHHCDA